MRIWLIFAPSVFLAIAFAGFVYFSSSTVTDEPSTNPPATRTYDLLLAMSWQPAFCEFRSGLPECRSQTKVRFDGDHFSLHGLWSSKPGQTYCGVAENMRSLDRSGNWRQLPRLELSKDLREELSIKMPGYRSYLHRHEWIKHGSCMAGMTPETYFRFSLFLLDAVNNSELRRLFARQTGKSVSGNDISSAFQSAFGSAAAKRLQVRCKKFNGRRLITELTLSVSAALPFSSTGFPPPEEVIRQGRTQKPGCPGGIVDRANR